MRGESHFCNYVIFAYPFLYRATYIGTELPIFVWSCLYWYNDATAGLGHVEVD
jgi:hypothetical protein